MALIMMDLITYRDQELMLERFVSLYPEIRVVDSIRKNIPYRMRGIIHGCAPKKRIVYVEQDCVDAAEFDDFKDVISVFHELCHVVVSPPFWSIRNTPEELCLFQFERALAQYFGFTQDAYDRVVWWQEITHTRLRFRGDHGRVWLAQHRDYETAHWWVRGYEMCRQIGLLDAHNIPTGDWPDWSRCNRNDADLRHEWMLHKRESRSTRISEHKERRLS